MSELLNEERPVREHFDVDNDMKAEWCLRKIRQIRADQKKEKEELARQMRFYQDQMDMIDKEADDDAAFFEGLLRGYFASRVDDGFTKSTKTKTTYKLPSGNLILKKQAPEYERKDEELLPWLKQNRPELVNVTESANWAELKKTVKINGDTVVTEDGEVVPGVKVTEREDKFEVEV
jgi:hypothetical protein